ncbi:MAG: HlyC/CorC family transporter [Clostridia bacterium]|nr:HlyC/CorC family transporter [Clostridia bacterium]
MMNVYFAGILILMLTCVTFFLHLSESAVTSANISRIKQLEEEEDKRAVRLAALRSTYKPYFYACVRSVSAVCTFVISLVSIRSLYPRVLAVFQGWERLSEAAAGSLSMICVAFAVLSFYIIGGKIIPRKIGIHRCETVAYSVAGAVIFLIKCLYPYIILLLSVSNLVVKMFGIPAHADEKLATEDEILMMVDASGEKGVIEESEADMIANIFEFGDTTASEAMTHRTDVEALEYTSTVRQAVDFALENGFSRIPVYKDDLDNIQGVLYVKDLLKFVGNSEDCDTPIYLLMRPACYIPETKKLSELFGEMTETKVQMAVVVDEYGGTSGIITMEDLIESILGNIQDEFDNEDEEISQVSDNTFTVDGTTSVYEVSDLLDIELPEGDYDTLAGYIVSTLGRIPTENEHPTVTFENVEFTVEQVTERRISKVRVVKNAEDNAAGRKTSAADKPEKEKLLPDRSNKNSNE